MSTTQRAPAASRSTQSCRAMCSLTPVTSVLTVSATSARKRAPAALTGTRVLALCPQEFEDTSGFGEPLECPFVGLVQ